MDENIKAFVMHIVSLWFWITIHLAKEAQMALLLAKEDTVLAKYLDFADMFLKESANVLPKQTRVNKHAIKLEKSKQSPYKPIYSLGPVEFKTFKTYIETNLTNGFIKASKSSAIVQILFVHKFNDNFCLCVDYQGLNKLMIINWYLLLSIGWSLNWSGQAKQLTNSIS